MDGVAPQVIKASLSGRQPWVMTPPRPSSSSVPPSPQRPTPAWGASGIRLLPKRPLLLLFPWVALILGTGSATTEFGPSGPGVAAAATSCSCSLLSSRSVPAQPPAHSTTNLLHSVPSAETYRQLDLTEEMFKRYLTSNLMLIFPSCLPILINDPLSQGHKVRVTPNLTASSTLILR